MQATEVLLELGAKPNIATIEKSDSYWDVAGATPLWKCITSYSYYVKENKIQPYFLPSVFITYKAAIKLFLEFGAVSEPALDEEEQLLFDEVRVIFEAEKAERAGIQSIMDSTISHVFPKVIPPLILKYV